MYNVTMRPFVQPLFSEKQYYKFWECVCRLMYPACTRHIVIFGLPGSTVFLHIISHMAQLKKPVIEYKMWNLNFSIAFVWNIFHSKKNSERKIKNINGASRKVPVVLSHFNGTWIFSTHVWKIFKYQFSWKSVQWEPSRSTQMNRQTWWSLTVAFHNFVNVPKKERLEEIRGLRLFIHLTIWN